MYNYNFKFTKNFIIKNFFTNLHLNNFKILDLFSGSGKLSFYFLKFNCFVVFIDINKILTKKINDLLIFKKNFKIITSNSINYLKLCQEKFNLVIIDPPFNKINLLKNVIKLLKNNGLLKEKSYIYIETKISFNYIKFCMFGFNLIKYLKFNCINYFLFNKLYF